MKTKAIFADRLKELRKEKKLSQRQIAVALGISHNTYKSWESGICGTNIDMLLKLADFFNVTTDQLLGKEEL